MQPVEQTSTRLIFQTKHLQSRLSELMASLPLLLVAVPFLGGGLLSIVQSQWVTLRCDRLEPTQLSCQLTASSLLWRDSEPQSLGPIHAAVLDVRQGYDSSSYQVMLITPTDQIPLTQMYTSEAIGKQRRVETINAFLADPDRESLTIRQNDGWVAYPVGVVFMLMGGGLLTMIFTRELQIACTFDAVAKKVRLNLRSIVGSRVQELSFNDIKAAEVATMTDDDGKVVPRAVELMLNSGKKIRLQISAADDEFYTIAQSMNQVLGVVA